MRKVMVALIVLAVLLALATPSFAYHHRWHGYGPYYGYGPYGGRPYYYDPFWSYSYPYPVPPVVTIPQQPIPQQPQTYIQQQPEQQYFWYWCPTSSPQGYHPYVQQCPGNAWLKVVPSTASPQ